MIALSWSRWKAAECPHRFNVLHVEKSYKEPMGEPAEIGQHVATILQTYRQYCLAKNIQSDIEWLLKVSAAKVPDKGKTDKILDLIEAFINTNLVNLPINPQWVRVESKLTFDRNLKPILGEEAWFSKSAAFRMVSDYAYIADKTLWIVDDKTGRGDSAEFQVKLYAYLLPLIKPPNTLPSYDRICCVFNELGKRQCNVVGEYSPGDVDDVRETIMAKLAEVNAWTEFPAKACSECKWCSVPGCAIRDDVETALTISDKSPVPAIPLQLTTQAEAEKAMLFLMFAEGVTDQVKELLRSWVQEHGPIIAGGKIAEERENKPWKVTDLQRLATALVAWGVPVASLWSELGLSESALEKLARKAKIKERLPMLLAMGERKDYKPKFGLYNDKLSS